MICRASARLSNRFVQALVAETEVEALDESILDWLARFDVIPSHPTRDPTQDSYTSQLGAIVRQEAVMADD
jgi:hypothetical protein